MIQCWFDILWIPICTLTCETGRLRSACTRLRRFLRYKWLMQKEKLSKQSDESLTQSSQFAPIFWYKFWCDSPNLTFIRIWRPFQEYFTYVDVDPTIKQKWGKTGAPGSVRIKAELGYFSPVYFYLLTGTALSKLGMEDLRKKTISVSGIKYSC